MELNQTKSRDKIATDLAKWLISVAGTHPCNANPHPRMAIHLHPFNCIHIRKAAESLAEVDSHADWVMSRFRLPIRIKGRQFPHSIETIERMNWQTRWPCRTEFQCLKKTFQYKKRFKKITERRNLEEMSNYSC